MACRKVWVQGVEEGGFGGIPDQVRAFGFSENLEAGPWLSEREAIKWWIGDLQRGEKF